MTATRLRLVREAAEYMLVSSAAENATRNVRLYETDPTRETYPGSPVRHTQDLQLAILESLLGSKNVFHSLTDMGTQR